MSEYEIKTEWRTRIRGAQRDLIKAAGGIERVAELLDRSVGHVGRWTNPALPDLMPIPVILLLEDDVKIPIFARVFAQMLHGRDLTEPNGSGADSSELVERVADVMESGGKFSAGLTRALADGQMTESELIAADRLAGQLERDASEVRECIAKQRSVVPMRRVKP